MLSAQALVAAGISTVQRWAMDKLHSLRTAVTAPDYLVKTSTTTLPAERVVTDTTSNTWDWATAGQAKVKRAALTGDVTASADTNTTTIANAAVSLAKMANLATDRLIGRDTAGTGVPEALTVGGGVEFSGAGGIQRSALTGDVTASAGSNATTLANSGVAAATYGSSSTIPVVTLDAKGRATTATTAALPWDDSFTGTASTTDGTVTTCGTYTVPDLSTVTVTARVSAVQDSHAAGAAYVIVAGFRRNGATVTQIGATSALVTAEDDAAWNAAFDVSSTEVRIRVTGKAATNVNWRARADVVAVA